MPATSLVQSLTRGLTLLELLGEHQDGRTLAQLCEALDLKPPTAHNLLRTLADRGFVAKRPNPTRYVLGPAITRLAAQQSQVSILRRAETTLLAAAKQDPLIRFSFAQYMEGEIAATLRASPETPGWLQRGLNQPMAPYTSASSLAFQAFWPAEERAAFRRRYPFEEFGAHQWGSVDALDAFLRDARAKGYAAPHVRDGGWRIAAPVFDAPGRIAGAFGGYLAPDDAPRSKFTLDELIELVTQAARDITGEAL